MEWWMILLAIFTGLFLLFAIGVPVGYAFLLVNMVAAAFIWAGGPGLEQTMLSIFRSVTNFSLLPLPLFILMGELIFNSGVADKSLDALDKWIGKIPGRLSMVAVLGGYGQCDPKRFKYGFHGHVVFLPLSGNGKERVSPCHEYRPPSREWWVGDNDPAEQPRGHPRRACRYFRR